MKKINHKATHRVIVSALLLACMVLMAVFSIMPISAYAETTIPDATSQFYVNDFADIFTDEEEAQLMETAVSLAEYYDGIQVVVTTIESLGGTAINDYAVNMYNAYGIGKNDMGLLILLSTDDREIWITSGLAMEAYFPDSKVGRFTDNYAIPYLAENKFNEGLINLQEAFVKEIISCVEKEASAVAPVPNQTEATTTKTEKHSSSSITALGLASFLLVLLFVILIAIVIYKLKVQKPHKSEVDSLREQLENERISKDNQRRSFESQLTHLSSTHSNEIDSFRQRYESLQQKYNTLRDRYNRAQTLHPEIDDEVSAMITEEIRQKDMAIARDVDDTLRRVIDLTASKDIVDDLKSALSQYSQLNESQKSYVTSDIFKVNALYNASLNLQREYEEQQEIERRKECAVAAFTAITAIIASISVGKARHLSSLKRAKSIYDNLDYGSRYYFDRDTAEKLDNLLAQAKRDKKREEDEEEARRAAARRHNSSSYSSPSYRSSSTIHSSSSHRGFGGHTGGGGAGRKF